jgi:inosose dehydratase
VLIDNNFEGWCTVEQDCDPSMPGTPMEDAKANREYLQSIGF